MDVAPRGTDRVWPRLRPRSCVCLVTNGHLLALALDDGRTIWDVELTATTSPVATDGLVVVSADGRIEARAGSDGRERGRLPLNERLTSLHAQDGWVFAGSDQGELLAVRASGGALGTVAWRQSLTSQVAAPPTVSGERVYVPLEDGRVLALALGTGKPLWTARLQGRAGLVLALDDCVFVGFRGQPPLQSLGKGRRRPLGLAHRRRHFGHASGSIASAWYFVSLDNLLRALDRDNGSLQWYRGLPMRPSSGALLVDELLIVAGVGAQLRAFAAPTGAPSGEFPTGTARDEAQQLATAPDPTPAPGPMLILATRDGRLTALTPVAAQAPPAKVLPQSAPSTPTPAPEPAPTQAPGPVPIPRRRRRPMIYRGRGDRDRAAARVLRRTGRVRPRLWRLAGRSSERGSDRLKRRRSSG